MAGETAPGDGGEAACSRAASASAYASVTSTPSLNSNSCRGDSELFNGVLFSLNGDSCMGEGTDSRWHREGSLDRTVKHSTDGLPFQSPNDSILSSWWQPLDTGWGSAAVKVPSSVVPSVLEPEVGVTGTDLGVTASKSKRDNAAAPSALSMSKIGDTGLSEGSSCCSSLPESKSGWASSSLDGARLLWAFNVASSSEACHNRLLTTGAFLTRAFPVPLCCALSDLPSLVCCEAMKLTSRVSTFERISVIMAGICDCRASPSCADTASLTATCRSAPDGPATNLSSASSACLSAPPMSLTWVHCLSICSCRSPIISPTSSATTCNRGTASSRAAIRGPSCVTRAVICFIVAWRPSICSIIVSICRSSLSRLPGPGGSVVALASSESQSSSISADCSDAGPFTCFLEVAGGSSSRSGVLTPADSRPVMLPLLPSVLSSLPESRRSCCR
mmetsp:Transcript_6847/g.19316  ORF Transcript_6847/g.19316 Transcript_6847/m.19316 type:complete len:447 (-) Transcript_6847:423-1763(-)